MRVGYTRGSTRGQSLDVQKEALAKAGCERIFEEKAAGAPNKKRPVLAGMLRFIREDDVLVDYPPGQAWAVRNRSSQYRSEAANKALAWLCSTNR